MDRLLSLFVHLHLRTPSAVCRPDGSSSVEGREEEGCIREAERGVELATANRLRASEQCQDRISASVVRTRRCADDEVCRVQGIFLRGWTVVGSLCTILPPARYLWHSRLLAMARPSDMERGRPKGTQQCAYTCIQGGGVLLFRAVHPEHTDAWRARIRPFKRSRLEG